MVTAIKVLAWYAVIILTVSVVSTVTMLLSGQPIVLTRLMAVLNLIFITPMIALGIMIIIRTWHSRELA